VDAAFMLLEVHGRGIHAVSMARQAPTASHGRAPGAHEYHGPQQADANRSTISFSKKDRAKNRIRSAPLPGICRP
jgi:hypothetical protein